MKRREFITLLGGAAVALPLGARAQEGKPVIGYLSVDDRAHLIEAFRGGLVETGYVEGKNVVIEYRFTSRYDQLPALAADLVAHRVAVLTVSGGPPVALAAQAATTTIPIVYILGADPIQMGLAASFNHPGGNATGVYLVTRALEAKRLEVLHELLPNATRVGVLVNSTSTGQEDKVNEIREAARTLGPQVVFLDASSDRDFDPAFATLVEQHIPAFLVTADGFLNTRPKQLVALATRHGIPTIYAWREFASVGGLMSYGTSLVDAFRQSGIYTGRVLQGERPADLPVQQVVKVELVLNLKTAKQLGITVPTSLLVRADEVIE